MVGVISPFGSEIYRQKQQRVRNAKPADKAVRIESPDGGSRSEPNEGPVERQADRTLSEDRSNGIFESDAGFNYRKQQRDRTPSEKIKQQMAEHECHDH